MPYNVKSCKKGIHSIPLEAGITHDAIRSTNTKLLKEFENGIACHGIPSETEYVASMKYCIPCHT